MGNKYTFFSNSKLTHNCAGHLEICLRAHMRQLKIEPSPVTIPALHILTGTYRQLFHMHLVRWARAGVML